MIKYIAITWPESQELVGQDGFADNSYPICSEVGVARFGAEAYFVSEKWLRKQGTGLKKPKVELEKVKFFTSEQTKAIKKIVKAVQEAQDLSIDFARGAECELLAINVAGLDTSDTAEGMGHCKDWVNIDDLAAYVIAQHCWGIWADGDDICFKVVE